MLDKKTTAVLKTLNKFLDGTAYKVITTDEILLSINQKSQYDLDSIRQIIGFLEKQEYLNIKFSEDNTYCYSLTPKARIFLEQETGKSRTKKSNLTIWTYVCFMIASFVGTLLALLIFFFALF